MMFFSCCCASPSNAAPPLILKAWGSDILDITAGCSVSRIFYFVCDGAQRPKNRFDRADEDHGLFVWWSLQVGEFQFHFFAYKLVQIDSCTLLFDPLSSLPSFQKTAQLRSSTQGFVEVSACHGLFEAYGGHLYFKEHAGLLDYCVCGESLFWTHGN